MMTNGWEKPMPLRRIVLAVLVAGLLVSDTSLHVKAQQQPASIAAQPGASSGWTFNIAPYLWLPTVNANLDYKSPTRTGRPA
jgi:hypothetical protein